MKFATRLVHFNAAPGDPLHPSNTPIYQTATFAQEEADAFGKFDYSRSGNPTRKVLEDQVAALEQGTRGFAFSSGMAAIATVTHLLSAGDEIVADYDLYGGASRLFGKVIGRAGLTVSFVDAQDLAALEAAITPKIKLVYIESPTNPLLRILDIAAISQIAHRHNALVCVDSSVMSPYLQNPLVLGADIALHSGTKFLCGHSDVTAGVIAVQDEKLAQDIYFLQNAEGTALAPFDSYLLLRGLKTLKLRMDAQQASALKVAQFLAAHPRVSEVNYPGLPTHPGYELQKKQATGPGTLLTFRAGSREAAKRIAEQTEYLKIAVSFGSVNSTISIPAAMSHASVPAEHARQIPDDLLRLSLGIEDVDDLLAALNASL
ncbi:trans-sulfuration enzyme family protein [Terriglobus tenax]|uniref:trans-sulfuration enzyme family protein n=1 Tax=Terriglobus tenax TaxID=1111115 RepID=UPI0021DFA7AB|nr:PLP-dependent aspartate aminotransferase family protein [Terriglobus tenax]